MQQDATSKVWCTARAAACTVALRPARASGVMHDVRKGTAKLAAASGIVRQTAALMDSMS